MKKSTIFILSFFTIFVALSSCKKDYSCKCTGTYAGISADTTISLGKLRKKDARSQCNSYQATYGSIAIIFGASINCEVK